MSARPDDRLGEERDVDLRAFWQRLLDRWWLPVAGLVLGAIVGVLVATGGGEVYEARTLLYLGQPFAPSGGGQIQSLATNPRTVNEIIRSATTLDKAAADSGLTRSQLRGNVTSQAIAPTGGVSRNLTSLIEIGVQASGRAKAEAAADSLAESVVSQVATYVEEKINLLQKRVAADEEGLETAAQRIAAALEQQQQIAGSDKLALADRILIQANVNTTLQFYEARQSALRADLNDAEQLLSLAENVEKSRVVLPARGTRETAASRRNGAVVGALIGLLLGALAAAVWPARVRERG